MKKVDLLFVTLASISLTFAVGVKNETKVKAEEMPDYIDVATTLDWESATEAGYGQTQVGKTCDGQDIVVGNKTYLGNVIGTHLHETHTDPIDIVYDISEYSGNYHNFEVYGAQPNGGKNIIKFEIYGDDLLLDEGIYRGSNDNTIRFEDEGLIAQHDFCLEPMRLNANVEGVEKLKLRLYSIHDGWWNGTSCWINPRLYNADNGQDVVYASDILERTNSNDFGWNFGYGVKPMLDQNAKGDAFYYPGLGARFAKGVGVHLRDGNYQSYLSDPVENSYHYFRIDIKDKGFSVFNTVAISNECSKGWRTEIYIDGVKAYASDLCASQYMAMVDWNDQGLAPTVIDVAIPDDAEIFEVRTIAEDGFANGAIDYCNAAFYRDNGTLFTKHFVNQTFTNAYTFSKGIARNVTQTGSNLLVYDSDSEEYVKAENPLYFIAGSKGDTVSYSFDIEGLTSNVLSGFIGKEFGAGKDAPETIVGVEIEYNDGSKKAFNGPSVTLDNSRSEFSIFYNNINAKTLTVYVVGDTPFSGTVIENAVLSETTSHIVTFYVNGEVYDTKTYFDDDSEIIIPDDPEIEGKAFIGWALEGEEEVYEFDGDIVLSNMTFNAVFVDLEYSSEWSHDEECHWHACTTPDFTDLKKDVTSHDWDQEGVVTIEPTYDEYGERTHTCTVCGATCTEIIEKKERPSVIETSEEPSVEPSIIETSEEPSIEESVEDSVIPSVEPSVAPSVEPSVAPSIEESVVPSVAPASEKEQTGGCGGSIAATGLIISSLGILGAVILTKKKEK